MLHEIKIFYYNSRNSKIATHSINKKWIKDLDNRVESADKTTNTIMYHLVLLVF